MIEMKNVAAVEGPTENPRRTNTTKHPRIRYTGGLHEGGHCAALHHLGIPIKEAMITVEKMFAKFVCFGEVSMNVPKPISPEVAWRLTVARLAGHQAILLLQPQKALIDRLYSVDDYKVANRAIQTMAEEDLDRAEKGGASLNDDEYEAEFKRITKALIAAAEQEAAAIVNKSRAEIIAIGRALAAGSHLTAEEIAGIIEEERGT